MATTPQVPPLPPGYTLDQGGSMPPLPPGYALDSNTPQPEQPGAGERLSEGVLGTAHPISDTGARLKQLVTDPRQFVSDAGASLKNTLRDYEQMGEGLVKRPLGTLEDVASPHFREDIANKNYSGAVGDIGSTILNSALLAGGLRKPAPRPEPIPGAPLTPGEAVGPGMRLQAEQLTSGLGNAERVKADFLKSRSAPLANAAENAATSEIAPANRAPAVSTQVADARLTRSLKGADQSARNAEAAAHGAIAQEAYARNIEVDPTPMANSAKAIMALQGPAKDLITSSLPSGVLNMIQKIAEPERGASPGAIDTAAGAQPIPGAVKPVPWQVMKEARTGVGQALQAAQRHYTSTGMGANAVATLSKLYGEMTDAMEGSLQNHPSTGQGISLAQDWQNANRLTTTRKATFEDPDMIRKAIVGGDPVRLIDQVLGKGADVEMKSLKKALAGNPQATKTAQDAIHQWVVGRAQAGKDPMAAIRILKDRPQIEDILGPQRYQEVQRDVARGIFDKVTAGAKGPAMGREDMFDAQHFAQSYRSAKPALKELLPQQNMSALDDLERTMRQYTHQNLRGGGGGFGRYRMYMAGPLMVYGLFAGNPYALVSGGSIVLGPKLYTELAMNPEFARSVSATIKSVATGVGVNGAIRSFQGQPYRFDGKRWVRVDAAQNGGFQSQLQSRQRSTAVQ